MEPLSPPSSVDEAEAMILAMYSPLTPKGDIRRIDAALRQLQDSPQGWQFADQLLDKSDASVQFWGASVLRVKLGKLRGTNSELNDDQVLEILQRLFTHYMNTLRSNGPRIVTDKLSSALVALHVRFPAAWIRCVRHFVACLLANEWVAPDRIPTFDMADYLPRLHNSRYYAELARFISTLVSEVGRIETAESLTRDQNIVENWQDILIVLSCGLSGQLEPDATSACLTCFGDVFQYLREVATRIPTVGDLEPLVVTSLQFTTLDSELGVAARAAFNEIWEYSPIVLSQQIHLFFQLFESPWSQHLQRRLLDGHQDDYEVDYATFLFTFAEAQVDRIVESHSPEICRFLENLKNLMSMSRGSQAEGQIFSGLISLWAHFADEMGSLNDQATYSSGEVSSAPTKRAQTEFVHSAQFDSDRAMTHKFFVEKTITDGASAALPRLQMPEAAVWAKWDDDDRSTFKQTRFVFTELLEAMASFDTQGNRLFEGLTSTLISSVMAQQWRQIELYVYCLAAGQYVYDGLQYDDTLEKVFLSGLFELIASEGLDNLENSSQLLHSTLDLIRCYEGYFQRRSYTVIPALSFLFLCLSREVGPRNTMLAAQTIETICSGSRGILRPRINEFLEQYTELRSRGLDPLAEGKVAAGISSVIQAIEEDTESEGRTHNKWPYLYRLVAPHLADARVCVELRQGLLDVKNTEMLAWLAERTQFINSESSRDSSSVADRVVQVAEATASTLARIAKGSQAPSTGPIDLEEDVSDPAKPENMDTQLSSLREEIFSAISCLFRTFAPRSDITGRICAIFRAGFKETEPSAFTFASHSIVELFVSTPHNVPGLAVMVMTMRSLVSSIDLRDAALSREKWEAFAVTLRWTIELMRERPDPSSEPELVQNSMEFIQSILRKNPAFLWYPEQNPASRPRSMSPNDLDFICWYSLGVVRGSQPLSKAAAADLWSTFLTIDSGDDAYDKGFESFISANYGQPLANALAFGFGGSAARSELDKLADPLKKLVHKKDSRNWLTNALFSPEFPSQAVTDQDKRRFLDKIIALRGARTTNAVVKEFWIKCRGTGLAYTS